MVDQGDLPAEYAAADASCCRSSPRGIPSALIEAMSCGLPCVVSNSRGNLTLVEHEVTGLLFDPERPDQLAAYVSSGSAMIRRWPARLGPPRAGR